MTDLEKRLSALLAEATKGQGCSYCLEEGLGPDELAVKIVEFLNEEYDRQVHAALNFNL